MIGKCPYCRRWHFGGCPQLALARMLLHTAEKIVEAQRDIAVAAAQSNATTKESHE